MDDKSHIYIKFKICKNVLLYYFMYLYMDNLYRYIQENISPMLPLLSEAGKRGKKLGEISDLI